MRLAETIHVLHAFVKKAKRGVKNPKEDLELARARLKRTEEDNRE